MRQLNSALEAQLLLCLSSQTNPDDEPLIQALRERINELEKQ